jgi:glycosyltransferase involved in cell wall biosynthesis
MLPLVTIICTCYNHADYVAESLRSVFAQTHRAIQLIVTDDASADHSANVIQETLADAPPDFEPPIFIQNAINQGLCKSFNAALRLAKGEFLLDLAADDYLLPERIARQVALFRRLPPQYGVVFSDAYLQWPGGRQRRFYAPSSRVPQGQVYAQLLAETFICTPTMLIKKQVLDELSGYDETLSYEDYDFWVRSSFRWWYAFDPEPLTIKNELPQSSGKIFYRRRNPHLGATLRVHLKAERQNTHADQQAALAKSVAFHFRLSFYTEHFFTARKFYVLLCRLRAPRYWEKWIWAAACRRISVYWLYCLYLKQFHLTVS